MTHEEAEIMLQKAVGDAVIGRRGGGLPGRQGRPRAIRRPLGGKGQKAKAPQKCAAHSQEKDGTNVPPFIFFRASCACCGGEYLKRRPWQETCSRDCQLIYLAARTFLKAYREGRADGLRETIEKLKSEVKK